MGGFTSFGQVIPVTGPNVGFPGAVSRVGSPIIVARQSDPTNLTNLSFGEPAVLIGDSAGGMWKSVAEYVADGGVAADITSKFAGIAVREVKTNLTYPIGVPGASQNIGYYAPGEIAGVLELGSITVHIAHGTPVADAPVYIRLTVNPAIPNAPVGGIEAAADGGNTVLMPNARFRTGYLDANSVAEITLLARNAA
jgi:hypothetical protein